MLSISLCAAAVFQGLDDTTSLWVGEKGRMSQGDETDGTTFQACNEGLESARGVVLCLAIGGLVFTLS